MLLRAEEEVGVHLSTIPRLSATGTACCPCSIASALVTFVAHVYPEAHFLCLSLLSEYLGKSPGPSVQRWVPSRSTRRDVNTSNEKERHDAIFRKVRGWVSAWQKEGIKDKKKQKKTGTASISVNSTCKCYVCVVFCVPAVFPSFPLPLEALCSEALHMPWLWVSWCFPALQNAKAVPINSCLLFSQ